MIFINKKILHIICLLTLTITSFGTTWSAAYPYTQQIDGQDVIVKAFPFDPYSGSPMIGATKVYFNNKLLYTIDRYYRERIFTSDDGQYLVIIHTSNSAGISSYSTFRIEKLNFNQPAIEVFKDGKLFKTFSLIDVVDTSKLANNGRFFYWGYSVDFEAFDHALWNCNYWTKDLNRREKKECLGGNSSSICLEWIRGCDSMKIFEIEKHVYDNSIYIENNSLFILTNQNSVVKLSFSDLTIQQLPFERVILNKGKFRPPKFTRKYKKVRLPDKFDQPRLKDGRSFEQGLADLFGSTISENPNDGSISIYLHLIINRDGKSIDFFGSFNGESFSANPSDKKEKDNITKLQTWLRQEKFDPRSIPKGFDGYCFLCIVDVK